MNWILKCLKQYADFKGRASRTEFWVFFLTYMILTVALILTVTVVGQIFTYAFFIPSLAVSVRRLHDINKSGIWYLVNFIPVVGFIWFFVLAAKESHPGDNQYGPQPLA